MSRRSKIRRVFDDVRLEDEEMESDMGGIGKYFLLRSDRESRRSVSR